MPRQTITTLDAMEILDSRSRPTLMVRLSLSDGTRARAMVPSGASTGTHEAVELRDHDPHRFGGLGVLAAVDHVTHEIADAIVGRRFESVGELDESLLALDGT
ncbi:MAG: phosphopyruvate hydratase, partial [Propionibacterium freudenreichii]